jgi:ribonucleotide reductase beta subunit family protein with ferritin-like domain
MILQDIVKEAVEIEKGFILDALPCSLIGMNAEKMSEYIEYVSDRL